MGSSCSRFPIKANRPVSPSNAPEQPPLTAPKPPLTRKTRRVRETHLPRTKGEDHLCEMFLLFIAEQRRGCHMRAAPPPPTRPPKRTQQHQPNETVPPAQLHPTPPVLDAEEEWHKSPASTPSSTHTQRRVVHMREVAASVNPLDHFFSFPLGESQTAPNGIPPPCLRCPNCKACQVHLAYCSGAYGLRHQGHWIRHRPPPQLGDRRRIPIRCSDNAWGSLSSTSRPNAVCRFEVGPIVLTRHLTHTSMAQVMETAERGGTEGTFAGLVCPRPLSCNDVFSSIFFGTTHRGRNKKWYNSLQRTAMRAVGAQAKALWELLTFAPDSGGSPAHDAMYDEDDDVPPLPSPPRRIPVDWRYPPWFFSLVPSNTKGGNGEAKDAEGFTSGMGFQLWLPQRAQHMLTAHVIEDRHFWTSPHSCGLRVYERDYDPATDTVPERDDAKKSAGERKWEGEIQCRKCYNPAPWWGMVMRRHWKEKDAAHATIQSRRSYNRRRKRRQVILGRNGKAGSNDVVWVNKRKTRAQFMSLLVAYMMRTTVCGPYKQRLLAGSFHSSLTPLKKKEGE